MRERTRLDPKREQLRQDQERSDESALPLVVEGDLGQRGPAGISWGLGIRLGFNLDGGREATRVRTGAVFAAQGGDRQVEQNCLANHRLEVDVVLGQRVCLALDWSKLENLSQLYMRRTVANLETTPAWAGPVHCDRSLRNYLFACTLELQVEV